MHDKYKRIIFYCPMCGWITFDGSNDNGEWEEHWNIPKCHYHIHNQLTPITDRTYESIYNQVAEENGGKYIKSTGEIFYVAKEEHIKDYVRREYVEVDSNELLNLGAYNMCLSMEEGAELARERRARNQKLMEYMKEKSQPKPASVIGRAVAGAAIAGPAGAVVGAVSALDKNMREKK